MKKAVIVGTICLIIGMLISGLGVYAAVSLTSDKVSYKDTTVEGALDNLFDESVSGKTKIAEAITNKGIETLDTDSYDTIVSNINSISTGITDADKKLYDSLKYSGLVTEDMTFDEMCNALSNRFPEIEDYIIIKNSVQQNYWDVSAVVSSNGPGWSMRNPKKISDIRYENNYYSAGIIYKQVDLTQYNFLKWDGLYIDAGGTNTRRGDLFISNSIGSNFTPNKYLSAPNESGSLDISSYKGKYYIGFVISGSSEGGDSTGITLTDFYLSAY